jgi:hypothetical protein
MVDQAQFLFQISVYIFIFSHEAVVLGARIAQLYSAGLRAG